MKILNKHLFTGEERLCERMTGKKINRNIKMLLIITLFFTTETTSNMKVSFNFSFINNFGVDAITWLIDDFGKLVYVVRYKT